VIADDMMERDNRTGRWRPARRRRRWSPFGRIALGIRAALRSKPITATIDAPPNDALWSLYAAAQAEGADLTWQPAGDAFTVDVTKQPPGLHNRVFLHLRGELRGDGPTSLTGRIAPDGQASILVAAFGLIFLVGGTIAVIVSAANLAFGQTQGPELFFIVWGAAAVIGTVRVLRSFARADESLQRVVHDACRDRDPAHHDF
jgi:hypothetical protein